MSKNLLNVTQMARLAKYPQGTGFIALSHGDGVVQVFEFKIDVDGVMLDSDGKPLVYQCASRNVSYVVNTVPTEGGAQ